MINTSIHTSSSEDGATFLTIPALQNPVPWLDRQTGLCQFEYDFELLNQLLPVASVVPKPHHFSDAQISPVGNLEKVPNIVPQLHLPFFQKVSDLIYVITQFIEINANKQKVFIRGPPVKKVENYQIKSYKKRNCAMRKK
jgi:hypothetical protein